jgi:hypothetical protein
MRLFNAEVIMVRAFDLSKLRVKQTPEELAGNRARSLELVEQFQRAQKQLEERCAELGIPVPVMVC